MKLNHNHNNMPVTPYGDDRLIAEQIFLTPIVTHSGPNLITSRLSTTVGKQQDRQIKDEAVIDNS